MKSGGVSVQESAHIHFKGEAGEIFHSSEKCGCTHCDGLAVHYLKVFSLDIWAFRYIVEQLPGSSQDKIDELMRAYPLIKSGKSAEASNQRVMRVCTLDWLTNCAWENCNINFANV